MRCIPWVGAVGSGLLLDRKRVICGRQRAEIAKEGRVNDENGMVDLEADSLIGLYNGSCRPPRIYRSPGGKEGPKRVPP